MTTKFIGRKKEQEILQEALDSDEAEMVSVIGRRRTGKTQLIKTYYKEHIAFEMTGLNNADTDRQLQNLTDVLKETSNGTFIIDKPKDWLSALDRKSVV